MGKTGATHHDLEVIHTELWVVVVLLSESGIDNVIDSVDGDRRLNDVGSDDDLPRSLGRGLEDLGLDARDLRSVDRVYRQLRHRRSEGLHTLEEDFARRVNLLLTREEDEDIAGRLGKMDLHNGDEAGVHVVGLGLLGVKDLDGEGVSGNGEDGASEEVLGELLGVEGGGGNDELEIGSPFDGS
jgi:hypothetical protein